MLKENYNLTKAQLVEIMLFSGLMATNAPALAKVKYKERIEAIIGKGEMFNVMCEGNKIMTSQFNKNNPFIIGR